MQGLIHFGSSPSSFFFFFYSTINPRGLAYHCRHLSTAYCFNNDLAPGQSQSHSSIRSSHETERRSSRLSLLSEIKVRSGNRSRARDETDKTGSRVSLDGMQSIAARLYGRLPQSTYVKRLSLTFLRRGETLLFFPPISHSSNRIGNSLPILLRM